MSRVAIFIMMLNMIIFASDAVATNRIDNHLAQDRGEVTLEGSIIDSACAIDAGSRSQSIELATISIEQILNGKEGPLHPFSIRLVHCVLQPLADNNLFKVTFEGQNDGDNFRLFGKAKGIALKIVDIDGNKAIPGKPLPSRYIEPTSMTLNFGMRLVGNHQHVDVGNYQTTIRFKLDYY